MKDTLETLRDVLLVFTVIILVYVLYKRLLRILGKPERKKKYPVIGEQIKWNGRVAELEVNLEEKTTLAIDIRDTSGHNMSEVKEVDFEIGKHFIPVDCSMLQPGRYYFRIVSAMQESSHYFNIA